MRRSLGVPAGGCWVSTDPHESTWAQMYTFDLTIAVPCPPPTRRETILPANRLPDASQVPLFPVVVVAVGQALPQRWYDRIRDAEQAPLYRCICM